MNNKILNKLQVLFILFIVINGLTSCNEEVISLSDLDISDSSFDYDLVIDGFISTEKTICKIQLSKPVSISDTIKYTPIDDASLNMTDGINTYSFELIDADDGTYGSLDSIQGIADYTYTVEVTYNDKTYTASDIMPSLVSDSIYLPFTVPVTYDDDGNLVEDSDENLIDLEIYIHNFGYNDAMMWQINDDKDSLGNLFYLDLYDLTTKIYTHKGTLPQGVFANSFVTTSTSGAPTDSLEIIKMAMSDEYYNYLVSVFNQTDWKSSMFSTISGNVDTNVSDGGIGYFYAINVKRIKLTYQKLLDQLE